MREEYEIRAEAMKAATSVPVPPGLKAEKWDAWFIGRAQKFEQYIKTGV